ncbi:hypothetical protein L228DRAFT_62276 [Xylona heveae TC161]|uniref:Uncharacterized protein n=1 Tax=Xylona heveae (strain CBS 132557 / TC161) TaxID=1328760 RepID=A0A165IMM7_XYLHT|nr:hypothetical protein L228DRAFT_62276 [Xylona heveae TC161]KZF25114.1 hypothetical protein L228DRAFT_62276 [Xylona heveae TC161]
MTHLEQENYLGSFSKLNSQVSLYKSADRSARKNDRVSASRSASTAYYETPTLVVLCTWLFAASKHIVKYAQLYQTRLSHAEILLVRPVPGDMIWTSDTTQLRNLEPAVSVIQHFLECIPGPTATRTTTTTTIPRTIATTTFTTSIPSPTNTKNRQDVQYGQQKQGQYGQYGQQKQGQQKEGQINQGQYGQGQQNQQNNYELVMHAFSNAGGHAAVQLAEAFSKQQGYALPMTALILDSCPGHASAFLSANALISALPKKKNKKKIDVVVKILGTLLIYVIVGVVAALDALQVSENVISKTRRVLNAPESGFVVGCNPNPKYLNPVPVPVSRVYLYSKADTMVPWRDVLMHAEEARDVLARFHGEGGGGQGLGQGQDQSGQNVGDDSSAAFRRDIW